MGNSIVRILPVAAAVLMVVGCASTQPESQPASAPETKAVADTKPAPKADVKPAPVAPAGKTYNVVRGDTLWDISGKSTIYGNPYQWPIIFKANRDKIQDADVIEPGQVLSVTSNPSAGDVDAAVRHAKTRGAWSLGQTEKSDLDYLGR